MNCGRDKTCAAYDISACNGYLNFDRDKGRYFCGDDSSKNKECAVTEELNNQRKIISLLEEMSWSGKE